MESVYTTHDVARLLGVGPRSVSRWIDRGLLPAAKTEGGHRRVAATALREFLVSRGRTVPSELGPGRLRVLFVDDEPMALRAFERAFRHLAQEIEVLLASGAAEGLLKAGLERPDAVVVDLHMPGIDGIELFRALRHQPGLASVRLIAVSAGWTGAAGRAAVQAGAETCLDKSFDSAQLLGLLRKPPPAALSTR
jgi:excisionase family DNA binding protein